MSASDHKLDAYLNAWRSQDQEAVTDILDSCSDEERKQLLSDVEATVTGSEIEHAEAAIRTDRVAASLRDLGVATFVADEVIRTQLSQLDTHALTDKLIAEIPALTDSPRPRVQRVVRRILDGSHPIRWCSDAVTRTLASAAELSVGALQSLSDSESISAAPIAARNASETSIRLENATVDPNDGVALEFFAHA